MSCTDIRDTHWLIELIELSVTLMNQREWISRLWLTILDTYDSH